MTRTVTTHFGETLSVESKKLVNEVRLRITQPIHPNFDNDFNVYRFIMSAERMFKNRKDIVDNASRVLNQHLRDELPDIHFEDNPIFKYRFLPSGEIQHTTDIHNRLLWFIEYATISIEGIAHGMQSSQACRYQFWQFEHMLRRINQQEEKTGKLSSLRHIVDMNGYEINPFTMLFVSSGTLSYYTQLFHYEHYPELVNPIELVNIAKWIFVPYRLVKTMMPAGFADRFRIHDGNFMQTLTEEMAIEDIPETLGGKNKEIHCIPAEKLSPEREWQPPSQLVLKTLEPTQIPSRKTKVFRINVDGGKKVISWYFRTDGDVYFGVFYEPSSSTLTKNGKDEKEFDIDAREMVHPWLKLTAKIVHEMDAVECQWPGTYYVVFCNRHSWIHKRTVDLVLHLTDIESNVTKRCYQDGTQSTLTDPSESLLTQLKLSVNGPTLPTGPER
ncbi:CRAL/TRIO domain-containing protein [Aphelenchoides avenae]|nr:CRAL/TRIO domain-containing protein [Aphelenchus avenae]